jgi:hypothetical protein
VLLNVYPLRLTILKFVHVKLSLLFLHLEFYGVFVDHFLVLGILSLPKGVVEHGFQIISEFFISCISEEQLLILLLPFFNFHKSLHRGDQELIVGAKGVQLTNDSIRLQDKYEVSCFVVFAIKQLVQVFNEVFDS